MLDLSQVYKTSSGATRHSCAINKVLMGGVSVVFVFFRVVAPATVCEDHRNAEISIFRISSFNNQHPFYIYLSSIYQNRCTAFLRLDTNFLEHKPNSVAAVLNSSMMRGRLEFILSKFRNRKKAEGVSA